MSIKKQYLTSKAVCKVTFKLSKEEANAAETASLVGEFNNWDAAATPMSKNSAGQFSVTLDLDCGKEFQYKYLLNGANWINDPAADKYVQVPDMGTENSVVVVDAQAEEPKAAAPTKAAPKKAAPKKAAAKLAKAA